MTVNIENWAFWNNNGNPENTPELPFLPSRSKRRMSMLSRMTLHVGHALLERHSINDVVFASRFGEITRQLSITDGILDDGEVSPAAFSYSVFNTPAALLSLTQGISGKTRAVYSGEHSLSHGLLQSMLALENSKNAALIFIMADEAVPEFYRELAAGLDQPLALGMVLTKEEVSSDGSTLTLLGKGQKSIPENQHNESLQNLHKWFAAESAAPFTLDNQSFTLRFKRSRSS